MRTKSSSSGPSQFTSEPQRTEAGMEFWIWHKAKRIRCLVPDNTLETLAQMPVSRDAQLLAVYYRHRRKLHDMAHTEVDRGVSVEPVLLDAELFQNVQRPAHRAIKGF